MYLPSVSHIFVQNLPPILPALKYLLVCDSEEKKKHYATKKGSERENIGINQLNRQIEPRKGVGCDAWLNISVEKLKKYFSHLGQLDLASKKYLMKREKRGRKYTTCIPNIQGKLL